MAAPATRQSQLAAIHMAQHVLGLSADDAVSVKLQVTGVASAGSMTAPQRKAYLAHLSAAQQRAGLIAPRPGQRPGPRPPLQRSVDDADDERWCKARALWHALAHAGVVHTNTDAALATYVKRQTKCDAWRFLNSYQVNTVIEALKKWCLRAHVPTDPQPRS
ncbi:MAG: regulatory protein GemA [Comamonadaceae bacterium]|nr:regulatory protein GemA [Comamonadaceae bacterium]